MSKYQALFLAFSFFVARNSSAQQEPPRSPAARVIPYRGHIELNGQEPFTGTLNMKFYIADNNASPLEGQDAVAPLWQEYHSQEEIGEGIPKADQVEVHHGDFTVSLGTVDQFPQAFFANHAALYLGIQVQAEDDNGALTWVEVGTPATRQRLLASPHAISASEAQNFNIHGQADVHGPLNANGGLFVNNLPAEINAGIEVRGADSEGPNSPNLLKVISGNESMVLDGNEIDSSAELQLQSNSGQRTVVGGGLEVRNGFHRSFEVSRPFVGVIPHGDDTNPAMTADFRPRMVLLDLGAKNDRVCFLTKTRAMDVNLGWEGHRCHVLIENDRWKLKTSKRVRSDAEVECEARCLLWGEGIQVDPAQWNNNPEIQEWGNQQSGFDVRHDPHPEGFNNP